MVNTPVRLGKDVIRFPVANEAANKGLRKAASTSDSGKCGGALDRDIVGYIVSADCAQRG